MAAVSPRTGSSVPSVHHARLTARCVDTDLRSPCRTSPRTCRGHARRMRRYGGLSAKSGKEREAGMSIASDPTPIPLRISEVVTGSSAQLALAGELDMNSTGQMTDRANMLLDDPSIEQLVINLAEIEFIDSSGLGALVAIRQWAHVQGKIFYIENAGVFATKVI